LKKIGYCLIGCGRISKSHLPAIASLKDMIDFVATVDTDRSKAEEAAKNFGARKVYTSIEEALLDPEIEAVDICLPHHLHEPVAVQAANHKKHILIEKPLARNLEEADRVIESAEKNGVKLMVGQSRRFTNAVFESKKIEERGEIGEVKNIVATMFGYMPEPATPWWSSSELSGGFLMSLWAPHILDYILWIYGEKPSSVYAQMHNVRPEKWDGEDEVNIILNFSNRAMANIYMSWNVKQETDQDSSRMWSSKSGRYERIVVGNKGALILEDDTELYLNGKKIVGGPQEPDNFHLEIKEFISSILEDREPLTSGKDNRKVIEVMDACRISSKEHRVVYLDERSE